MAQVLPHSHDRLLLDQTEPTMELLDTHAPLDATDARASPRPFQFPAQTDDLASDLPSDGSLPEPALSFFRTEEGTGTSHRHPRKQMSLALPPFTFHPGASDSSPGTGQTTPSEPRSPFLPPPQSSPSRSGRHRRVQSEFIGGDPGMSPRLVKDATFSEQPTPSAQQTGFHDFDLPSPRQASKGHRHRRSGAVSSQDLSAVARQTAGSTLADVRSPASTTGFASPSFPPPSIGALNRPGAEYLRSAGVSPSTSKSSSPVRVSFADNIEVIPRRSLPSLRNRPIPPTARLIHSSDGFNADDTRHAPAESIAEGRPIPVQKLDYVAADGVGPCDEPWQFPASPDLENGSYSAHSFTSDNVGTGEVRPSMPGSFAFPSKLEYLDDQFGEPGDATVNQDLTTDIPLDLSTLGHTYAQSTTAHNSDLRSSFLERSESVVDLDSALDLVDPNQTTTTNQDLRNLRAKSFSAARRSMHSSGLPQSVTIPLHRRTESAPSLPSFDRPVMQRMNSATASEKGFEMENVFEEDEEVAYEDTVIKKPQSQVSKSTLSSEATSKYALEDISEDPATSTRIGDPSSRSGTSETIVPAGAVSPDDSVAAESWLNAPAVRDSVATITPEVLGGRAASQLYEEPHSLMSSPPATPGTSSGAWASSAGDEWPAEGTSTNGPYSEASSFVDAQQLGLPKAPFEGGRLSSDGTPSLISSRSTMTSGAHRQGSSAASPYTVDSVTLGGPPSSSGSASARWRKRSSIASLTRLMSATGSTRSHLSVEYTPRCQTSDGLGTEGKSSPDPPGKRKKLGRLLKYFRPKDPREQAPG